jgi:hypothetical protein
MPLFRTASRRCLASRTWEIPTHMLDQSEAALVAAIAEQLVPLDEVPGSSPSRVVHFIDQQLECGMARLRPAYHQGLQAFECTCKAETGCGFLDLSPSERGAYLSRIERGHKLAAFFEILREHARRSLNWDKPLQFQKTLVQRQHAV